MYDKIQDIALDCMVRYVNDSGAWSFTTEELEKFGEAIIRKCASNKNWEETTDQVFGVPFNFTVLENMGVDVKNKLPFNTWKNECIHFDKIEYDLQFEFLSKHGIDVMKEVAVVLKDEYWKYLTDKKYLSNEESK